MSNSEPIFLEANILNILSGDNPKQSRWKFIVEDELYGKLTCSYDLEKDFVDGLDVFFSVVIGHAIANPVA